MEERFALPQGLSAAHPSAPDDSNNDVPRAVPLLASQTSNSNPPHGTHLLYKFHFGWAVKDSQENCRSSSIYWIHTFNAFPIVSTPDLIAKEFAVHAEPDLISFFFLHLSHIFSSVMVGSFTAASPSDSFWLRSDPFLGCSVPVKAPDPSPTVAEVRAMWGRRGVQ